MKESFQDRMQDLRLKAELFLNQQTNYEMELSSQDLSRVIHDLRVYQIELEIQNEELRNTQKNLENAKDEFASLFNHSPVGYIILDKNAIIRRVNQTFTDIIGYEGNYIIGKSFSTFLDEYDKSIFLGRFNALFKNPDGKIIELCLITKDFSRKTINLTGKLDQHSRFYDNSNPEKLLLVNIIDVTQRKLIEQKLYESENYLELAMEASEMAWWRLELPTGNVMFNEMKAKMIGYNNQQFKTYEDFTKLLHPDDFELTMNAMRSHLNGLKDKYEVEYRIRKSDGNYLWLKDIGKISYRDSNKIIIMGVVININELKNKERILEENEKYLKELNDSKDKLFSIIAHDLRAPFSGFIGLTKMLASDSETMSLEEMKNINETIHVSAVRIYNLLNDLLMWARSQRGVIPYNPEIFDIYEIVYNSINLLSKNAESKSICLKTNIELNTLVHCDYKMIMTVIRNLIDNAIKFSNQHSEVFIKGELLTKESFENEEIIEKFYQISVIDSGQGIENDLIEKLFKIDKDVTRVGTNGESGTGLGLILCKEFVEKHGGKIWVECKEGIGSTFFFTLPLNN